MEVKPRAVTKQRLAQAKFKFSILRVLWLVSAITICQKDRMVCEHSPCPYIYICCQNILDFRQWK